MIVPDLDACWLEVQQIRDQAVTSPFTEASINLPILCPGDIHMKGGSIIKAARPAPCSRQGHQNPANMFEV